MKKFLTIYLTFSNRDKKGVLVLLVLLFFFIAAPYFIDYFEESAPTDFTQFEKDVRLFQESNNSNNPKKGKEWCLKNKSDYAVIEVFKFNPNNLPDEKWRKLGLREGQIKMIKHYESKGGTFRKKEDFQKMYCITPSEYKRLEPFIFIPSLSKDTTLYAKKAFHKTFLRDNLIIGINTSDSATLTLLNGIGPGFASRIIKYRKRLGGFYKKEQLMEVYGLDSILYNKISDHLFIQDLDIQKININRATFEEFRKHPYIGYHIANLLVNYRKAHGMYKDVSEIKKIALVNEELYLKLANYITID